MRFAGDQRPQDRFKRRRQARHGLRERLRFAPHAADRARRSHGGRADRSLGDRLPQQHAHRVEVGPRVGARAPRLLRRCETRRSQCLSERGDRSTQLLPAHEPEVQEPHPPFAIDQDVVGLQIAVDEASGMDPIEHRAEEDPELTDLPPSFRPPGERLAVHELGDHVGVALVLPHVVERHHALHRSLIQCPHFAADPGPIFAAAGLEELDRAEALVRLFPPQPHLPARPGPEGPQTSPAPADELVRLHHAPVTQLPSPSPGRPGCSMGRQ